MSVSAIDASASANSTPISINQNPGLTPARFIDMYKSMVTAAVDTNNDGQISRDEYVGQILAAGGTAAQAQSQYAAMDKDGDHTVSDQEFFDSVKSPYSDDDKARALQQIQAQIQSGMGTGSAGKSVLTSTGQVADPDQMLRYLVANFPGNMRY